ncbi:MAG: TRAP transporter large permease [Clostridiales bacterium]|nr:TRAP transporter large permease [Clostridiales bacterium]
MPVMTLTLVAICAVLFIFGVPIAVALGLASFLAVAIFKPVPDLIIMPQLFSEASVSFTMLAVPLFILVGNLMECGSIGKKLIDWVSSFVSWMTGGLGVVNIVASMIFGGISGSSLADTATFGSILVPRMVDEGYDRDYSGAITMTSSCLSVIIPPSILMVLAAAACNQSVSRALAAGVGPGVFLTLTFMIPNYIICKKRGYGVKRPFRLRVFLQKTKSCMTAIMAPLIILVSIFSGAVTPTEGAGVAVLYILIVDGIISRNLSLKNIWTCVLKTAELTSVILLIATSGSLLNYVINFEDIPGMLLRVLTSVPGGRYGFLVVIILIMIAIGMTMDASPASIIFSPLFMPAALALGIDPSHFLIIMIFGLAIGLTTPPYGVCIFSTASVTGVPMQKLIKESLPFYAVMIVTYLLVAFVPAISLTLPTLLNL